MENKKSKNLLNETKSMKEYNRKFNSKRSAPKREKMFSYNTSSYASHESDQLSDNQVNDQGSVRSANISLSTLQSKHSKIKTQTI